MKFEFSRQVLEKYSNMKISWKSAQWEPNCSIWVDGQTDIIKRIIVIFRNLAKAPNRNKWKQGNYEVFTNTIGRPHQDDWHDRHQAVWEFRLKKTEKRSFMENRAPDKNRILAFKSSEICSGIIRTITGFDGRLLVEQ